MLKATGRIVRLLERNTEHVGKKVTDGHVPAVYFEGDLRARRGEGDVSIGVVGDKAPSA